MTSYGLSTSALRAQRQLGASTDRVSQGLNRLSSGSRINRPSDDAASLSVASSLDARVHIYTQAIRNVNDGVSALNIADGALSQVSDILQRQTELASQAANGAYSSTQRSSLNTEAQRLRDEFNRIIEATSFNGLGLLSGSSANIQLQAGQGASSTYALNLLATSSSTTYTGLGTYSSLLAAGGGGGDTLATGDFNGDGRDDVATLVAAPFGDGANIQYDVYVYLADAQGQLNLSQSLGATFPASTLAVSAWYIGIGDSNGDNHLDIGIQVNYDLFGPQQFSTLFVNNGLGAFAGTGTDPTGISMSANGSDTGDFNGDGVTDTVDFAGGAGLTSYIQNTSSSTQQSAEDLRESAFSLLTASGAQSALDLFRILLETISTKRGTIGALQSRLQSGLNNLGAQRDNFEAARSRIVDVDVAVEAADLTRNQILQRMSASVLASIKLEPQISLGLLRA